CQNSEVGAGRSMAFNRKNMSSLRRTFSWAFAAIISVALSSESGSPARAAAAISQKITPPGALPDKVNFYYHVKPIISDRCFACHGPDEKARKAKLRLDTREGALKALEGGMFVVKPGDAAHSELVRRISTEDPDDKMPPPKSKLSLTPDEIAL